MENALTDLMYELSSRDDVRSVRVTDRVISGEEPPLLELTQRRRQPHAVIALPTAPA
jgi:ATP-dependent protease Clp ATPase subunit